MPVDRFEGVGETRPYRETAAFYAEHRHMVSEDFVATLVAVLGWTPSDRVLDLGAGPGQIARRLAPRVGEVVAVDPEADMLEEGRRRAAGDGVENIVFVAGSSDDLSAINPPAGQFRTVTIGSAFHWMHDQDRVLRDLDHFLDPVSGAVVIVSWDVDGPIVDVPEVDLRPWRSEEPWSLVRETLDRYLADVPAGPHPAGRHDPFPEILARSAFSDIQFLRWEYEREVHPSVDAAIGFEYSMSNTLSRLGDRRPEFESEVRAALSGADMSPVRERVVDSALIGRRPATPTASSDWSAG